MEHNLGQHYIGLCQETIIANVEGQRRGGPRRLSECPELPQGLEYLRRNLECIFTNMKSYPLLMQVYSILLEVSAQPLPRSPRRAADCLDWAC